MSTAQRAMPVLPDDVSGYRRTPTFDESSVPKGLLRDHRTKDGTWGRIHIESGSLMYRVTEPGFESEHELTTEHHGVIQPTHLHYVEPRGRVRFFVEFYAEPE